MGASSLVEPEVALFSTFSDESVCDCCESGAGSCFSVTLGEADAVSCSFFSSDRVFCSLGRLNADVLSVESLSLEGAEVLDGEFSLVPASISTFSVTAVESVRSDCASSASALTDMAAQI